ncbi:Uncharacterised protein [Capnocytophaga ochracea]|uniref:Uncharacterized protein n=1 Tax=Capnocytophaga ochracea TaxID=1018 RepID=A0A7Z8YBD9_CAPOC|nr:Uncharacterised protein [Capnocytophaga ochracea]
MLGKELIKANEDIITISTIAKSMGWGGYQSNLFNGYCI